jgi:hypothetical protein
MKTDTKSINDPNTVEALKHLEEMYNNARVALVEGKPIILIQSIDVGKAYLNQDLFNEVKNDHIRNHNEYTNIMLLKLLR